MAEPALFPLEFEFFPRKRLPPWDRSSASLCKTFNEDADPRHRNAARPAARLIAPGPAPVHSATPAACVEIGVPGGRIHPTRILSIQAAPKVSPALPQSRRPASRQPSRLDARVRAHVSPRLFACGPVAGLSS